MMGSSTSGGDVEAGFAKLQGEDFEYYMQTYSIILGRNSKKSTVDVDLSSLGGGMNISRHHARIFYDFRMRRFTLEVLGKNGCMVEGVLHLPGHPLVKLDSQDLLQIGDKKFYFLLPIRSILGGGISAAPPPVSAIGPSSSRHVPPQQQPRLAPPHPVPPPLFASKKRRAMPHDGYIHDDDDDDDVMDDDEEEEEEEDDEEDEDNENPAAMIPLPGKRMQRHVDGQDYGYSSAPMLAGKPVSSAHMEKKSEARSRADREADNHQLLQLEEKDVVSSVATVLSDLCGPGEWMPMAKLHSELVEQYGNIWHHGRVRRYLTSEEIPLSESKGKPWFGLLTLLRKYPEHFVINTRSKGRVTSEFVSLVSLLS